MIHCLSYSLNMRLGGFAHFPNRSSANRGGSLRISDLMVKELGDAKELIHLLKRQTCDTISDVRSIPGPILPLVSGMKNQTKNQLIGRTKVQLSNIVFFLSNRIFNVATESSRV